MKRTAKSGSVRVPDSSILRIGIPQAPPVTWWSITTARHPSDSPVKKTYAKR